MHTNTDIKIHPRSTQFLAISVLMASTVKKLYGRKVQHSGKSPQCFFSMRFQLIWFAYSLLHCVPSHMSGRNIWINFEDPQQYIRHYNPWKKFSNLMRFLKYLAELFLRPLRSKDVRCWILRLQPQNFVVISESLAASLEKVRQPSVWQTVAKFWFIWHWYLSFCIIYNSRSLRNNRKDK